MAHLSLWIKNLISFTISKISKRQWCAALYKMQVKDKKLILIIKKKVNNFILVYYKNHEFKSLNAWSIEGIWVQKSGLKSFRPIESIFKKWLMYKAVTGLAFCAQTV